jgi:phosphoribosylformylglycinamidine cyclo-ligase
MSKRLTYKRAGVDIEAAEDSLVEIKRLAKSTFGPQVLKGIGAFCSFYAPDLEGIEEPVLVSSVDSVGTKLKIAFALDRHDTVGEDLVNHCVNDILVHGAKPLFFLDYFATSKLEPEVLTQVVSGLSRGLKAVGCALVGGETAELPDFYSPREYDLAGFIVGVVSRKRIINGEGIKPGDRILGLASSGLHTNGFSLARKALLEVGGLRLSDHIPELTATLGEELLKVHRCYSKSVYPLLEKIKVKGMAHITGGGMEGNLDRILPDNCDAEIDTSAWEVPPIFTLIQRTGNVETGEMFRTFNMGIGLIAVVSDTDAPKLASALTKAGEKVCSLGKIVPGKGKVNLKL